jgi:hypothetical protein
MHPIQDLFLKGFSYVLQIDMHFYMHSYLDKKIYSCKKWVLQSLGSELPPGTEGRELPVLAPMEMDVSDPPPREGPDRPTSGVLHQRGPPRSQDKVPGGPQAVLCSPHHL